MTETDVSESAIEITRTTRIGRERDNDVPKPLLYVFRLVTQADQI